MNSFLHTTTFSLTVGKSISSTGTQLGIVESEYSVNLEVLEMDISEYSLLLVYILCYKSVQIYYFDMKLVHRHTMI